MSVVFVISLTFTKYFRNKRRFFFTVKNTGKNQKITSSMYQPEPVEESLNEISSFRPKISISRPRFV